MFPDNKNMKQNKKLTSIGLKTNPALPERPACSITEAPCLMSICVDVRKMDKTDGVLTGVGARQVVPGIRLFDDVLVDLVPLTLSVTPETERWDENRLF